MYIIRMTMKEVFNLKLYVVLMTAMLSILNIANDNILHAQNVKNEIPLSSEHAMGFGPKHIAVNIETNLIYVVNLNSSNISVISSLTNKLTNIFTVGHKPLDIQINPVTNLLYVTEGLVGNIHVVDAVTFDDVGIIQGFDVACPDLEDGFIGNMNTWLGVNTTTNTIYVAARISFISVDGTEKNCDNIWIVDGLTNKIMDSIDVGDAPLDITINPITNRIYTISGTKNKVIEIDGSNNEIIDEITIEDDAIGLRINPITNRLYIRHMSGNTGHISVVDGFTKETIAHIDVGIQNDIAINIANDLVYVSTSSSDLITVIDGKANEVAELIEVGRKPKGIAVDPVANLVYVANFDSDTMSIIDGSTNRVINTVVLGQSGSPVDIGINIISNSAYIVNSLSQNVSVLDTSSNEMINLIAVNGTPEKIAFNSESNFAYVTIPGKDTVAIIDGSSNKIIKNILVEGKNPQGIAVDEDRNLIYIANKNSNNLSVLDGDFNEIIDHISLGPDQKPLNSVSNPPSDSNDIRTSASYNLDINTISNKIYVIANSANAEGKPEMVVIDGENFKIIDSVNVGNNPNIIKVDRVFNNVYVTDTDSDTVTVVAGASNEIIKSIPVGISSDGLGVNSKTNHIFVSNRTDNSVSVIDVDSNIVSKTLKVGLSPNSIGVNPETNLIYVANSESNSITVIEDESLTTPTSSPFPTPTLIVSSLNVVPATAKSSLRLEDAIVTVLDQDGAAMSEIKVIALTTDKNTRVLSETATTDENGIAKFKFRFGFLSNDGKIIFKVNKVEAVIAQKSRLP